MKLMKKMTKDQVVVVFAEVACECIVAAIFVSVGTVPAAPGEAAPQLVCWI
jgi:hypothetical protein